MEKAGNLLIVDDNKAILIAAEMLLKNEFEKVITTTSPNTINSILQDNKIDVILLDMNFVSSINSGNEGLFWLSQIRKIDSSIQVVLFTAYADIELAVRGIKEGATDFVVKPWDNAKLVETLRSAYDKRSKASLGKTTEPYNNLNGESGMYWGNSKIMTSLRNMIEKVAATDANILITGENGTGKEMLAREIHLMSSRRKESLVSVDMGAITETLFESELFGHVKGAFTDARADRVGKFEAAGNGTLFLDEIGNLPYHLQAKLLTVLQQRYIVKVGSNQPIPINIRLVCATNKNLQEMVVGGKFREDLLYRINTIHIQIPSLRERKEDIVPLAELFLKKFGKIYNKSNLSFSRDAEVKLQSKNWMGNIRELEHAIEKAVIIADKAQLQASDFENCASTEEKRIDITTLEDMEYNMIKGAMEVHGGNLSMVANQLGISRQTLYNKLKRFGL